MTTEHASSAPRHLGFPSIPLFRIAIKTVAERAAYSGLPRQPKLRYQGAVKLHGVNAGIVFDGERIYAQSREIVITPQADNAGFARWVYDRADEFQAFLAPRLAAAQASAEPGARPHSIALFGEWFGKGVQSGVGVSSLDRTFAAFGLALVRRGLVRQNEEMIEDDMSDWTPPDELSAALAPLIQPGTIRCVQDYPTWTMEIDFESPAASQALLEGITHAVEKDCPVARALGAPGIGEGVVWTCVSSSAEAGFLVDHRLSFKVKGAKHSDNASKDIAPVDIERVQNIQACARLVGAEHRFEKALDHIRASSPGSDPLAPELTGAFLKWIAQDVIKEESDTIAGNGLDPKDVNKAVGQLAVAWRKARLAQRQAEAAP